jgi:hypothetical protein
MCGRFTGWVERMAEMTGVKTVDVTKMLCVAEGEKWCEWRVKWL